VAEPIAAGNAVDPRLAGIDLPRVDVEHVRLAVTENPPDPEPEDGIRDQPEVAAAAPRESSRPELQARDTDFVESLAQLDHRLIGSEPRQPSVPVVRDHREARRVVGEADLLEDRDRPVGDRESGRAVSLNRRPGEVLEQVLRTRDVVAELVLGEGAEERVAVAVRRDLVPFGGDPLDERRAPFRNPAEDEARRAHAGGAHQLEQAVDVPLDSELARVPCVARDHSAQVLDLKPVLDVDRHDGAWRRSGQRVHEDNIVTDRRVSGFAPSDPPNGSGHGSRLGHLAH
jgi:hypothetical protein